MNFPATVRLRAANKICAQGETRPRLLARRRSPRAGHRLTARPAGLASLRRSSLPRNMSSHVSPVENAKSPTKVGLFDVGAQGETRTPMPLRALPPQGSASTSFATCAAGLCYSALGSFPTATGSEISASCGISDSTGSSAAGAGPIRRVRRN